jgi:nitrate/nitrite transport system substrate-binding protein
MANKSTNHVAINSSRRKVLTTSTKVLAGASLMALVDPLVKAGAWAAGSDAPEKTDIKIGFIPLTDCASVVMASEMGFDKNTA